MLIESQTTEFKQIWKDEHLKTVCAFANTDGGVLYVGFDDFGDIVGIENSKKLIETLPNKINNRLGIIVDIILKEQAKKNYLEIVIKKTYAPISYNGKFYLRSGSNTIELNGSNLTNFLLKKYGKTWDDIPEEKFTLDEIDLETIEKFKKLSKDRVPDIEKEDNIEQLLRKLNLYDGNYLKRAAILLFAKNPQKYYIQSHSKIGKFLNDTEIQSSDIVEGNLLNQVDKIMDILRLKYLKAYISYEGMHRRERLEYPFEALREAVINALIHRDYTNTSNLQIKVFENKLIMYNGATLSTEVPIDKFYKPHQSKPFNPTMANIFYKCGYIENWGRGTNNIIKQCLDYDLPKPKFEYEWTAVVTTFFKADQKTNQKTDQKTDQKSTKEQILENLEINDKMTRESLAEKIGVSSSAIKQHIAKLQSEGRLKRVGGRKEGFWKVLNTKE